MSLTTTPRPIGAEFPNYLASESNHDVPMVSAFYRGGTFLAEALDLTVERAGDPPVVSVISAGCGPGYEVDSVVSLYKEGDYGGRIEVEGYDFNVLAIRMAQQGLYTAHNRYAHGVPAQEVIADLGYIVEAPRLGDGTIQDTFEVNSGPIREGADISFIEHDLSQPLPREEPADLILANNVIQHLRRPGTLGPVLRNLASLLTDRGVLSIGEPITREASAEAEATATLLRDEFDMEPLFHGPAGHPAMFGRS